MALVTALAASISIGILDIANAQDPLPMSARIITGGSSLSLRSTEIRFKWKPAAHVVVYEIRERDWRGYEYRITPDGFSFQAWVGEVHIELTPNHELPEQPAYLEDLARAYRRQLEDVTVTGCAVASTSAKMYRVPGEAKKDFYRKDRFFPAGETFLTHRQQSEYVQIRSDGRGVLWVRRADVEIHPLIPGLNAIANLMYYAQPCRQTYRVFKRPSYTFIRSGAYYKGPTKNTPPVAFYAPGDKMVAASRYSADWYLDDDFTGWVPASDLIPENGFPIAATVTTAGLSAHTSPSADNTVVYEFKDGAKLGLFAVKSGWFRVTPSNLKPAWVKGEHLSISTAKMYEEYRSGGALEYYLKELTPPPPPPPVVVEQPALPPPPVVEGAPEESPRLFDGIRFILGILAFIAAVLMLYVLVKFSYVFSRPRDLVRPMRSKRKQQSKPSLLVSESEVSPSEQLASTDLPVPQTAQEIAELFALPEVQQHRSLIDRLATEARVQVEVRSTRKTVEAHTALLAAYRELAYEVYYGRQIADEMLLGQLKTQRKILEEEARIAALTAPKKVPARRRRPRMEDAIRQTAERSLNGRVAAEDTLEKYQSELRERLEERGLRQEIIDDIVKHDLERLRADFELKLAQRKR